MLRKKDEWINHEIKEITFYILLGIVMTIIIPIFIGFGLQGFEESFVEGRALEFGDFMVTYMIYYIIIVAGLIGLPILKIREMFVTRRNEHPANQSNPNIFSVAYIHDPEQDGLLYNLFKFFKLEKLMFWSNSIFRMFVIGIVIFGIVGLFQLSMDLSFADVPEVGLKQQMGAFGEVFFSVEPPAFAETTMMLFVFSLLMGFNAWVSSKIKIGKLGYFTIGVIICLLIGAGWMSYHSIVYGNDEAKLQATFIFGTIGALITLLFGSFIFWYIWHFMNNLFVKLGSLAVMNEDILLIAIIFLIIFFLLWILGEFLLLKFRKNKPYIPEVPT